jgi:NAD(P)-dependent dehydrogenase (short-subunit alcohol dehydrogenase family)
VRVVGINPGRVETDRVIAGFEADARLCARDVAGMRAEALKQIPMGRLATPDDIARLAVFLASDAASYLTGVNISVDGAQTPVVI